MLWGDWKTVLDHLVTALYADDELTMQESEGMYKIGEILSHVDTGDATQSEEASRDIQAIFKEMTLPTSLKEKIMEYHRALAVHLGVPYEELRVAVRSSTTQEDKELTAEMKAFFGED